MCQAAIAKPLLAAGLLTKIEIMTMKKAALLAGIYAATAMDAMSQITNPYDGLPEMRYNGSKQPERKTQLTKKQKKKRSAAKSARKARMKQRH